MSLDCLPDEVIHLIAFHLAIQSPFRPPIQLVHFYSINKQTYQLLRPYNNHQLYADLFRSLFDLNAIKRRLSSNYSSKLINHPSITNSLSIHSNHHFHQTLPTSLLCNRLLADAYFERLALFRRMRQFAIHPPPVRPNQQRSTDLSPYQHPPSNPPSDTSPPLGSISRDLWLIYLMILENDDRNWTQLLKAANVNGFLLNYFHYEIYPSATAPGYPSERPEIAIALRLCHLFLDLQDSDPDGNYWTSETGIETYLFALKPYTFASHRYDVAYVPCSIRQLPINLSSEKVLLNLSHKLTTREKAALLIPIGTDPSEDEPSNPLVRTDQLVNSPPRSPTNLSISDQSPSCRHDSPAFQPTPKYCELVYMGQSIKILPPLLSHVALLSFFWCNIRHAVTPSTQSLGIDDQIDFFLKMMRKIKELKSEAYDKEFLRLTSCLNPFESQGLKFDVFQNCFQGGWDGQFGFLDLSNFRQMLAGRLKSVYEGRYGDQNQVFKSKEFIVRIRDGKPVKFIQDSREAALLSRRHDDQPADPDSLNHASNKSEETQWEQEEPQESEIEHLLSMKSLLTPKPIEPIYVKYDPSERYELQIHGAGHSSWGRFQVKGRVRAWDGMLTFLKIYDAGRHGRWLYRGYYSPGDMIVGRWRDTLTSEGVDGYEGTFVMFKRN